MINNIFTHTNFYLEMLPDQAVRVPVPQLSAELEAIFGAAFREAMHPENTVPSPVRMYNDGAWAKRMRAVGVNIRTIGHFWNLVPYAMTLPEAQNAIHILPIWEPGVVASLYGPSSWNINPEFYSPELAAHYPLLNTVEAQLKCTINVLHLLNKAVGMDVVPHTDRFSEMALGNPHLFEWLQRKNLDIVRHDTRLFEAVQDQLFQLLQYRGSAVPDLKLPASSGMLFYETPEKERLRILFGEQYDYAGRLHRRKEMVELLFQLGYETVPATMGPPYRGIEVDPDPAAMVRDEEGRIWRDYRITRPEKFSRVFGPLARYRLYESKNDNRDWELDFDKPNLAAWTYVCGHYRDIQTEFNIDFMRGDMSHVQMRPEGVPADPDPYYDLLGAVKQHIMTKIPYFAYFAESFLAPPGEMAYGDECDHLEASFADSTLGDLQSEPVGTDKFMRDFAQYRHWLDTRQFAPNFTIMTADKDDPRFDRFYLSGNEIRYFVALFLTDMPSYMGLGFECRDPHPVPAPNEHYTKLYVFQEKTGPKSTQGPYQWGQNVQLYRQLNRQKQIANQLWPLIAGADVRWLLAPDPEGHRKVIAWTQDPDAKFIFVAHFDTEKPAAAFVLQAPEGNWQCVFSTADADAAATGTLQQGVLDIQDLQAGEGRIFARV